MISIAIIDIIGLTYDGDTLNKRGLGGSESAVILLAKELSKKNFKVTVFNNCIDKESKEGIFDNVEYIDHSRLDFPHDFKFDVVISSRTVIPFLPKTLYDQFVNFKPQRYSKIKENAKLKAMWMHDTFSMYGDHLLEDMIIHKDFDEIFTLSDFHTSYVTTCSHGKKRMFEVLKKHIFMTRNGIVKYKNEVDIKSKDPFLYVFNAALSKGMVPLVENIWERIKKQIPQAKLKVIGGFYKFKNNEPDIQEIKYRKLILDKKYKKLDVEFTGIIKQSEIADIMAQASFMLFPCAFPETSGISTLESIAYNTPLITNRFGALEETAIESACYLVDYPIEPNGLFPQINKKYQEDKFVETVLKANADRYLHQQKMYACNIIKDVVGWDSVALQWKQHIYKKLGLYLLKEDYKKVSQINSKVKKIFARRFSNHEENYIPRNAEQKLVIITPTYNSSKYIEKCIESVITQDYDNYLMVVIDDCSTDNTYELAKKYENDKVKVIRNTENKGAVRNQIEAINSFCERDNIVMFLDGDDSLVNDNQIFHFYNNLYDGTTEFSYGSCWSMIDNIPLVSQPYPEQIKKEKKYRSYKFNWNMPYTHLRTFKAYLLENVDENMFKDEKGNWYKAGGDGSIFYTLIEKCQPENIKVVQDIVYNYNDTHSLNDYKVNAEEQTKNANRILTQ
jgi:glycosyltransferase involved in cell wall biosynthesis